VPITAKGGEDGLGRLGSYCLSCVASRLAAQIAMQTPLCEVCKKREAVVVGSCTLAQAISHAYCQECIKQRADPIWCFFAVIDGVGGLNHLADWCRSVRSYYCGEYIKFGTVKDIYLQLD